MNARTHGTRFHAQAAKTRNARLRRKGIHLLYNLGEFTTFLKDLQQGVGVAIVAATGPALLAVEAEQEDEIVLEPGEEFA